MNTAEINGAVKDLEGRRKGLKELTSQLAALEFKAGQTMTRISINGVEFELSQMGRESGWMPYAIEATNAIRLEDIKLMKARISAQASKVEGAEFALRNLVRHATQGDAK